MGDSELEGVEGQSVVVVEVRVWGWTGDLESECGGEVEGWVVEPGLFEWVDKDFGVREAGAGFEESGHVVCVGVGEDDFLDDEFLCFDGVEEGFGLVSAVNDPAGLSGGWVAVGDDVAVGLEVSEGEWLDVGGACWCGLAGHVVYYLIEALMT